MKKYENKNKIVFTGGHAGTTAFAVFAQIEKEKLDWEIHWIGPKKATEGKNNTTLEAKSFTENQIKFHSIFAGRLQRKFSFWTIPSFLKIPLGFLDAFRILAKIRPKVILSFGGYAAFPVVVVGRLFGIPVIIHEQTAAAGRANQLSTPFAKQILLAKKESLKYFPAGKSTVIGNPTLESFFLIGQKEVGSLPVVFITGGSRGSQIINDSIISGLDFLLTKYKIIHQVGDTDYEKFIKIKNGLDESKKENYTVYGFIKPNDMPEIYQKSDVIVGRAGANTVSEIIAAGKKAVFIPIPWSYLNEQEKNAKYAQKYILAEIITQDQLNPNFLMTKIDFLLKEKRFVKKENNIDQTAALNIVGVLKGFL